MMVLDCVYTDFGAVIPTVHVAVNFSVKGTPKVAELGSKVTFPKVLSIMTPEMPVSTIS